MAQQLVCWCKVLTLRVTALMQDTLATTQRTSHCSARLCVFVSRYEVTKARPSRRIAEEVGMGLLASALLVRKSQPFCFHP